MLGGSSDVQKWVAFIICGPCQRMENISIRNWAATIINHENSFGLKTPNVNNTNTLSEDFRTGSYP